MILWEMALMQPLLQMPVNPLCNRQTADASWTNSGNATTNFTEWFYIFFPNNICCIWICITRSGLCFWEFVAKYPIKGNSPLLFWTHRSPADSPNYSILLYCIFTVCFIYLCCAFKFLASIQNLYLCSPAVCPSGKLFCFFCIFLFYFLLSTQSNSSYFNMLQSSLV